MLRSWSKLCRRHELRRLPGTLRHSSDYVNIYHIPTLSTTAESTTAEASPVSPSRLVLRHASVHAYVPSEGSGRRGNRGTPGGHIPSPKVFFQRLQPPAYRARRRGTFAQPMPMRNAIVLGSAGSKAMRLGVQRTKRNDLFSMAFSNALDGATPFCTGQPGSLHFGVIHASRPSCLRQVIFTVFMSS